MPNLGSHDVVAERGGRMTCVAAIADKHASGCSISFSGKLALVIAALASASGAAALIADFAPITWDFESASSKDIITSSFNARFFSGSESNLLSTNFPRPLVQSLSPELEIKLQEAKG